MKTCSKCGLTKKAEEFNIDRTRGKLISRCKACRNAACIAWRKSKPTYETDRYQATKQHTRERHLVRKYKVSLADYNAMLVAQKGGCAICGALERDQFKGVLHVDHCHETGRVRGLLCRGCNHMLGSIKDDTRLLQKAIDYLNNPPAGDECVPQVAAEILRSACQS